MNSDMGKETVLLVGKYVSQTTARIAYYRFPHRRAWIPWHCKHAAVMAIQIYQWYAAGKLRVSIRTVKKC